LSPFRFSAVALDTAALRAELTDPGCGAYAAFEGWVRNHNEGQRVTRLLSFKLLSRPQCVHCQISAPLPVRAHDGRIGSKALAAD